MKASSPIVRGLYSSLGPSVWHSSIYTLFHGLCLVYEALRRVGVSPWDPEMQIYKESRLSRAINCLWTVVTGTVPLRDAGKSPGHQHDQAREKLRWT